MKKTIFRNSIFVLLIVSAVSCKQGDNGVALLSSLFNQRMTVVLKGTYATDNPLSRSEINNNHLFVDADDLTSGLKHRLDTSCSVYVDPACIPSYDELPIWIDIGELRLSSRSPLSDLSEIKSADDANKFWDTLSVERQVYCSIPYDIGFDSACIKTGGLVNFQEFTNGRGAVYPSRDVPSGVFLHSGIYVRAMAFGYGALNGQTAQDKFDNRDILGTNVISLLQYDPNVDDLTKQLLPPQWFPLHHKVVEGQEAAMVLDHGEYAAVLEMRFNLIENLMVHSFVRTDLNQDQIVVAPSDWRKGHDYNTTDRGFNMGGNVLARSRIFYPHQTNTLIIGGGSASTRHYYALYVSPEKLKEDNLPYAATPVRNGSDNELKYIMPGPYVIQCRYDCNNDGYPELLLSESGAFVLGNGPGTASINHPCGCGIDSATVASNSCVAHTGCY